MSSRMNSSRQESLRRSGATRLRSASAESAASSSRGSWVGVVGPGTYSRLLPVPVPVSAGTTACLGGSEDSPQLLASISAEQAISAVMPLVIGAGTLT